MKFCRSCGSALAASPSTLPGGGGSGPMVPPATGGALGMLGGSGPYGGGPMMGAPMSPPPPYGQPQPFGAPIGVASTLASTNPMGPPPMMSGAPGQMPSTAPGMLPPQQSSSPRLVPPPVSAPAPAQQQMITCPRCSTPTPVGFAFCQGCGLHMQGLQPTDRSEGAPKPIAPQPTDRNDRPGIDVQAATMASQGPRAGTIDASPPSQAQLAPQAAGWGTAVLVNRDGSDGQRFTLAGEYTVIGRGGADIAFDDDRFLARQHARLERAGDGVKVHSLDTLNGVFKKADLPVDLVDGMTILVGREVLRYEKVDAEETKVHPLIRHGVALFGSPPREPWGRFVQIIPSGGYRDVRHLAGEEIVLGREEGDIVFRDDAFMSRRHAAVTWDGKRAQITDLGSSNGTFVRITGPTTLKHGDHVRMGDQLLRIELAR